MVNNYQAVVSFSAAMNRLKTSCRLLRKGQIHSQAAAAIQSESLLSVVSREQMKFWNGTRRKFMNEGRCCSPRTKANRRMKNTGILLPAVAFLVVATINRTETRKPTRLYVRGHGDQSGAIDTICPEPCRSESQKVTDAVLRSHVPPK